MRAHAGKSLLLLYLLAASAMAAESHGPFYSPVTGFSNALIPILEGFEKAKIEKTLRGFIARADSAPGFKRSETDPSESGLYLNVSVRDAEEVKALSDSTEEIGVFSRRTVKIPAPPHGDQAIVIELDYGGKVPSEVLRAIDSCIKGVVAASVLAMIRTPNHALELTAARTVFTSSMTTFIPPHLTLAPGGRSSACSR
jgi:hypothetical protein